MNKKILIIDDDPLAVKFIENILNDNGYQTFTAASGNEGLEQLKHIQPDLITLDIQMPDEWGPRFFRKLTKNDAYKQIPVIVISGLSSSKYALPKSAGYLSKPFSPEDLLQLVTSLIG